MLNSTTRHVGVKQKINFLSILCMRSSCSCSFTLVDASNNKNKAQNARGVRNKKNINTEYDDDDDDGFIGLHSFYSNATKKAAWQ
jgi:hypothetical protein